MRSRSTASLLCRRGLLALGVALGSTQAHAQTVKCDEWITSLPIERNNAKEVGIRSNGYAVTVRNNQLVDVGFGRTGFFDGIVVTGDRNRILDNDIVSMSDSTVQNGRDVAIHVSNAGGTSVEGNRITLQASAHSTIGIMVEGSSPQGDDVLVVDNRISGVEWGIYVGGGLRVKYRDNLTLRVTHPFGGGTDAGNNN